jgi:sugar O-acyltransferase (sialic acid O-acetyltransferase NeuD family)
LLHDAANRGLWDIRAMITPDGTVKKNQAYLKAIGVPLVQETFENLMRFRNEEAHAIVAIGHNATRKRITEHLHHIGIPLAYFVGAQAYISRTARVSHNGVQILNGAYVGPGAVIGDGVILNHKSMVEHYAQVGAFSHIAPGATLLGAAEVGEQCLIGANATLLPDISVPANTTIGAGSVVCRSINEAGTYVGAPVKRL